MENGKKYAIGATVVLLLAVGIRVGLIYKERHDAGKATATADYKMPPDDLVFLKHLRPDSLKDVRTLIGKTLWVSAAGQMDYYPYASHRADYSKSQGVLLGAVPLVVQDVIEQVAPKSAVFRIPAGDRHVLLVFTLPKSSDPAALYAVPVGYREAGAYTFYTDQIFFYDDPHTLYSHWKPEQWAAVDAHKVILGMSEHQCQIALGQVSSSQSQSYGNRTVTYNNQGHPVVITFEDDKATAIHGQ
jgi:hypothetical protein